MGDYLKIFLIIVTVIDVLSFGFYIWGEVEYNNKLSFMYYIKDNAVLLSSG